MTELEMARSGRVEASPSDELFRGSSDTMSSSVVDVDEEDRAEIIDPIAVDWCLGPVREGGQEIAK